MILKCKDCGKVIKASRLSEWNQTSEDQKAASSPHSLRREQCIRCMNEERERPRETEVVVE